MTAFDEREKAFEDKFKHDQDLNFRIQARRAKLAGLWAADLLGLEGQDAVAYARQVVETDMEEPGVNDIVRKIHGDLIRKGVDISEHRVEKEMERLLEEAKIQVCTQ